jgi:uncharacterized protein (TIGR03083 family)
MMPRFGSREEPVATLVSPDELVTVLRASHERLAGALSSLSDSQLVADSYCRGWSVAQVASHLGSSAEIFSEFVDAGLEHEPAGSVELQPVWDKWNAKSPRQQADDVVQADREFLSRVTAMSAQARQAWELDLFGARRDLASVLQMRLAEHELHTWDIAVVSRPSATLAADAAMIIVDNLAELVERSAKPTAGLPPVHVVTSDPRRSFTLDLGAEPARLGPATGAPNGNALLALPAEAFVRLVYGRLDAGHTPQNTQADGIDLDALRGSFPGF